MNAVFIEHDASREYWFAEGCFILELANSPADPALSIARARVPAGGTTRWHRLRDTSERYCIEQGTGLAELITADGPLQTFALGSGDVLLIPAGCAQRIRNTGDSDLVFLALCTPRFMLQAYEDLEASGERSA